MGETHPGKKIRLFFQDEARIGQKGRVCHRWFTKGKRPPGRSDQRYTFAYLYGAVEPGSDNAFALILPEVSANAMQVYLDRFAETIGPDEHVLMPDLNTAFMQVSDPKEKLSKFKMTWHYASGVRGVF